MRLLFVNFSPLSVSSGHTFRLDQELDSLSCLAEVSVLCVKKGPESYAVINKYKSVSFYNFTAEFKGWEITNVDKLTELLVALDNKSNYDLIVVNMEVWALIRVLALSPISKKVVLLLHGVPFIGFMRDPSQNFEKDVLDTTLNQTEKYKTDYNLRYFRECSVILSKINCIAANKTVAYSLSKYFPNLTVSVMEKYPLPRLIIGDMSVVKEYDFVFFARIEKGKGVEYLKDILEEIQVLIGKKITVAILGRAEDGFSKNILDELLSKSNPQIAIKYFGHLDHEEKTTLLLKTKVMLYPSVYDNNPTVIYEALALGIPVIVWDTMFYKLNFSEFSLVKSARFYNVRNFAHLAVESLYNEQDRELSFAELVNSLYGPKEIAEYDLSLFRSIIERNG